LPVSSMVFSLVLVLGESGIGGGVRRLGGGLGGETAWWQVTSPADW